VHAQPMMSRPYLQVSIAEQKFGWNRCSCSRFGRYAIVYTVNQKQDTRLLSVTLQSPSSTRTMHQSAVSSSVKDLDHLVVTSTITVQHWHENRHHKPSTGFFCNYYALGRAAKYCDEYICLSVCLPVYSHNSKTGPNFTNFCACCHGSVLFWRH